MPVQLDADAAAVYKAFQEAGRPAYETLTPQEARDYYLGKEDGLATERAAKFITEKLSHAA